MKTLLVLLAATLLLTGCQKPKHYAFEDAEPAIRSAASNELGFFRVVSAVAIYGGEDDINKWKGSATIERWERTDKLVQEDIQYCFKPFQNLDGSASCVAYKAKP